LVAFARKCCDPLLALCFAAAITPIPPSTSSDQFHEHNKYSLLLLTCT
jgi:hypothetical protein